MLLRSSSTPVLGSLLSSFSETPNNSRRFSSSEVPNITTPEHAASNCCSKISYNKPVGHGFTASLYSNSSPISPSVSEGFSSGNSLVSGGFRRAQSEGNLEALAGAATSNYVDDFTFSIPNKKLSRRPHHCSTLEVIPSFSYHNSSLNSSEYDEDSEDEEDEEYPDEEMKENHETDAFCDASAGMESFCFEGDNRTNDYAATGFGPNLGFGRAGTVEMEMHLARGLGISEFNLVDIGGHINGGNGGGGQGYTPVTFGGGDGADGNSFMMEEHYKNMLNEDPNNSLCLRNYAQFLHQTKKDLPSAEEYYGRAILADPTDGEVLCQYAKLVWELYHDSHRAKDYFERAVHAAGEDSHVQAAYACFLWETGDEDEDYSPSEGPMERPIVPFLQEGVAA
ncbi:OLC1v1006929C1 [Oldenlandia corymbosa var. corymbosa]|uniref:OLC1v1006929C1 n=1 Tax=Oldenlandia corymbosa var. corymbosa TaxID=529605 RepID=A0AAV1DKJ9_OLDCO|nr:OLC1v1006929C1 [Oldenlandia corymbosa var. corymbosa]